MRSFRTKGEDPLSKEPMKTPEDEPADEMLPEYDFSGGIRGKHHQAYRAGHTVKIHRRDGSVEEQHFAVGSGTVELAPDVQAYSPDAESVNRALRGLIRLIPRQAKTE